MKATSPAPQAIEHPPLARDAQGNLLAVPEGTCAWRICRHTKGRPRIGNGPDKQPARFPLDTTMEDLADACGADAYRVYALDEVGTVIDYVTTVEVGRELRNAGESEVVSKLKIARRNTAALAAALAAAGPVSVDKLRASGGTRTLRRRRQLMMSHVALQSSR